MRQRKISKRSLEIVQAFDEAAQVWGWEQDQGTDNVANASQAYLKNHDALLRLIERLEKKVGLGKV